MPSTALLVIDVQPEWYGPTTDTYKHFPNFAERLTSLLARCRAKGTHIIHIRAKYDTSPEVESDYTRWHQQFRRFNPEKPLDLSGDPTPWARELDDGSESVFNKPTFNAFLGTELHGYLQERGINKLILAGLITSVCVQMTANEAFMRGYEVNVVSEACADRSRDRHEAAKLLYSGYVWNDIPLESV
ncbi:triuret hydrolase TrtA-like isoform X2 [Bolinopsis microptera]|uniref:triuret hydrolase TrtA-like isoform X2 n=1 Tax=Bolinopsis microptera TaxID=2820187 RepID=UPI003079F72A